jgi:peptide-methionine (S)-S-oxide reductase
MADKKATFAAGCFWGVQYKFDQVEGVRSSRVGYLGGTQDNPTYKDVCSGKTGHAEVVEVCFDDTLVSYEKLLAVFFSLHDPTQVNRQGPDVGTQYRSAIFYHDEDQRSEAEKVSTQVAKIIGGAGLATEISPTATFYSAEEYHQKYVEKNPGSCHLG